MQGASATLNLPLSNVTSEAAAAAPDGASNASNGGAADGGASERPRFRGRLVQGVREADEHGDALTVDELRALEVRGAPVAFEHKSWAGRVGTITDSYVDDEGWLWIAGELFSERDRPGSEMPGFLRENLRNNNLRDLSISYTYERDPVTRRRCGPRRFREASLVARGHYKGTHLVAVQASSLGTHGALTVAARLVCELVSVAASRAAQPPAAAPAPVRAPQPPAPAPAPTPTPRMSAQQQQGASASPDGITGGMSVQQVLDTAATAGVQFQAQEIANKSVFELMTLFGKKMQDKAGLIERAEEVMRRDQERHAAEYGKRYQEVKKLAAEAGYDDAEGLGLAEALFANPEAAGAARMFSSVAERASKTAGELEAERKVRAEMEAKMKEVEGRLSEYEARDQIASANQRKRAADGRYTPAELAAQNAARVPARMAAGGGGVGAASGTTTTTTAAAAGQGAGAGQGGGGGDSESLVSVEASAARHVRSRGGDDAMAARAEQILASARSLFPLATHTRRAFASAMGEDGGGGSRTISVQASAATFGSVSGGISERDRKLIQRLISGGDN